MKKENIFDLFEAQQKEEPAPAADRVPGEVRPEDVAPAQEAAPAPDGDGRQRTAPEPKQEPAPEPKQEPPQEVQEGGTENGV